MARGIAGIFIDVRWVPHENIFSLCIMIFLLVLRRPVNCVVCLAGLVVSPACAGSRAGSLGSVSSFFGRSFVEPLCRVKPFVEHDRVISPINDVCLFSCS